MKLIRSLEDLPNDLRGGAVAIGNFDGIHLGHAQIVHRLRQRAADTRGPAVVFTFDPHPVRLLRPTEVPPPLTWTDRKAQLLSQLGIDAMVAYPTDEQLLALGPDDFFKSIILDSLQAKVVVEGPNFFFGHNRTGDVNTLARLCEAHAVQLEIVEPVRMDNQYISSSRVRMAIRDGDVQAARAMLTKPYRIRGMVTHGALRGGKIGFPTANMDGIDTLLPAIGVYAGRTHYAGDHWPAAINIGPNPTFGENRLKVEVHLIDFTGSLYGEPLEVDFLARIRGIRQFESAEELTKQLRKDIQLAKEHSE